ncbi:MAG: pitrilysin family protein [Coriobacteriia bacterium]
MFFEKTVLANGVTVLSEAMDAVRSVALGIWFQVGSRDEVPSEGGMSHFLEHMLFKGTPTRTAAEISETFDRLGGELNAFTSKEYTCYYARILDEHVPAALEVLADMAVDASLAEDACTSEREVVLEEISRHEDTPDDRVHELLAGALWPTHPIGRPVLGETVTVGGFDSSAARAFKTDHYVSGNAVVAAAGAVDHDELVAAVEARLSLPAGPRTPRVASEAVVEPRLALLTKDTEQAHICWSVAGLHARHEDRFVLSILDAVLGGGMSSRLFQEIREKKGLAYAVFSYHSLYADTGQFVVYAGTRPANAEQVVGLIREGVDRVREHGVTAEELHRAKESIKGQLVLGLESTRNRMTRLGKSEVTHGETLSLDELVERVDAVGLDDVRRLGDGLLSSPPVLAIIGPFAEEEVAHFLD